jgi:hypothetical protein
MQILMASAAFVHSLILAGDSAGFEDDPGRQRPIASIAVDMVFAVYIPPHAPAPGHHLPYAPFVQHHQRLSAGHRRMLQKLHSTREILKA